MIPHSLTVSDPQRIEGAAHTVSCYWVNVSKTYIRERVVKIHTFLGSLTVE